MKRWLTQWLNSERSLPGQSTVIGFVLLISIVMVGTTSVLLLGAGSIANSKQVLRNERAESTLAELDSEATAVQAGRAQFREVPLRATTQAGYYVNDSAGHVVITVRREDNTTEVVNRNLGEIRYDSRGTQIAFQGGGVWRQTSAGSVMISPPEFSYRKGSITLPVLSIGGSGEVEGSAALTLTGTRTVQYPTNDTGSRLTDATVTLSVQSAYYQAWASFFEDRMDVTPVVSPANETVTVTFEPASSLQPVQPSAGVISGASDETIELDNNACIDTYNATNGGWNGNVYKCDQSVTGDSIITQGGIKLNSGQTKLRGNVTSNGTVETDGGQIKGSVRCTDGNADCVTDKSKVTGDVLNTNRSITPPSPVTDRIVQKEQALNSSSDNDNAVEDDISGTKIDKNSGVEEISAGQYYLSGIDRDSNVVFNTTEADITLVVNGTIDLDGAHLTVEGSNDLVIYMPDQDTEMVFDNGALLTVEDTTGRTYNSEQVRVFGTPGFEFDLNSESQFTGVVYAPEGDTDEAGEVELQSSVIFGAVIAHVEKMDEGNKGAYIHYDTSLTNSDIGQAPSDETATAKYMHVTTSRINVTEASSSR